MARRRWLPVRPRSQQRPPFDQAALPPLQDQPRRLHGLMTRRSRPVAPPWPQIAAAAPIVPPVVARSRRAVPLYLRRRPQVQPPVTAQPVTAQALPPQPTRHRTALAMTKRRAPVAVLPMPPAPLDDVLRPRVKMPVVGRRARLIQPPIATAASAVPAYPIQTARPHRLPLVARRRQPVQPPWPQQVPATTAPPVTVRQPRRTRGWLLRPGRNIEPPWPPQAAATPPLVFEPARARRMVLPATRRRSVAVPPMPAKSHVELVQRIRPKPGPPRRRPTLTVAPPAQAVPWSPGRPRVKLPVVKRAKLNHPGWTPPPVPNPPLVFSPSQQMRPRGLLRRHMIAQQPWAEILGRIGLPPISATGGTAGLGTTTASTSNTSVAAGATTSVTATTGSVDTTTAR